MNWEIRHRGFDPNETTALENRFLIGNGYLGIRGSLEEFKAKDLPAINLAGHYDQVGDAWREPLNAPNGLYTVLSVDGLSLRADTALQDTAPTPENAVLKKHELRLDFKHGILYRESLFLTRRGNIIIRSARFADRTDVHRICLRYEIEADFHAEAEIVTGIDGQVWDINGPHYDKIDFSLENGDVLHANAVTHEKGEHIHVLETLHKNFISEDSIITKDHLILHRLSFVTRPGIPCTIDKCFVVLTDEDTAYTTSAGLQSLAEFYSCGFEEVCLRHHAVWESLWENAFVSIEGDEQAETSLNYSLYHLQCIAPRHTDSLSIPARGLSGQTYKGAVFWDTEMFMLDYFLFTDPQTAKTLLQYRVDTLDGARKKAASYGYSGAFYAWESQESGFDACSDYNVTDVFTGRPMRTFFRDKQVHISAAVVWGLLRYTKITGDTELMTAGGFEVILECALFYESLLTSRVIAPNKLEISDVIGPDEYHERVNNNAYTNRMAKLVLESAAHLLNSPAEYGLRTDQIPERFPASLADRFCREAEALFIPSPGDDLIIDQFDGYRSLEDCSIADVKERLLNPKEYWGGAYGVAAHTQIIKQADVVTMLNLFSDEYSLPVLKANWDYYEPRTEHGSSLSASMYGMLACKCGMPDRAYPFFIRSAMADLTGGGKEWAGLIYIGGTHPAAAGGAYMIAIEGFAGVSFTNEGLQVHPSLPSGWKSMTFTIMNMGRRYKVRVHDNQAEVTLL